MRARDASPVLSIRDLVVRFDTAEGTVHAVEGVSYDAAAGETLGVVGESGCGKSVTVLAALGLLPQPPARVVGGEVLLQGRNVLGLDRKQLSRIRGKEVAMVFQDPMTSLHPAYPVADQVAEAVRAHRPDLGAAAAKDRAVELLDRVGVPGAADRGGRYPHEWSGGMRQRAMIAMAVAHHPKVLIADEPTTALDVTVQAQVLELLAELQRDNGMAIVLISHDLGVIAEMADRVVVMYAGKVVEVGAAGAVFAAPRHPYTAALLASLPRLDQPRRALSAIPGAPPDLAGLPPGCAFHPRCAQRGDLKSCLEVVPRLRPAGAPMRACACHLSEEPSGEAGMDDAEAEADVGETTSVVSR